MKWHLIKIVVGKQDCHQFDFAISGSAHVPHGDE